MIEILHIKDKASIDCMLAKFAAAAAGIQHRSVPACACL